MIRAFSRVLGLGSWASGLGAGVMDRGAANRFRSLLFILKNNVDRV